MAIQVHIDLGPIGESIYAGEYIFVAVPRIGERLRLFTQDGIVSAIVEDVWHGPRGEFGPDGEPYVSLRASQV